MELRDSRVYAYGGGADTTVNCSVCNDTYVRLIGVEVLPGLAVKLHFECEPYQHRFTAILAFHKGQTLTDICIEPVAAHAQ